MNTHLFHTLVETVHWHKSRIWKAPYNLAQEFHVCGLEWDPGVLRFTVDGAVVREERNTHWHQPLALCFDSETFAGWFGLPKDDALPATFSIDYMRTWKREGRERAGEAPGSASPPTNGYHAVGVDVRPLAAKPRGTVQVWELPSEGGSPVRVTVRH
ncbi:MAG TPA: family 16 glycosylhydrolase [Candidatus Paceibacterota bacterium]|nr:family 16 glycosylhydrolase [Candidatus Paceibacterota bacterium]HRZ54668.1 family 16 glycosylhydrolase [Candidatus Paceibacterota bacterium]